MKHTLLVAAIASLGASSAFAQSSVNVYGRLNLTLESINANGVKSKEMNNNSSRIGFKGVEDLGGGLKAGFVIEHGFSPDDGKAAATFWGRQSEVNLSGGFGTVRLGNFVSEAYFATADYISMHNHDTGDSSDALYAYIGRNTDKIAYRTPDMGGFTAEVATSLVDKGVGTKRTSDLALNYGSGPLHLGFGYEKGQRNDKQFAISGLYEMGPFVMGAMVQRDTNAYGNGNRTNVRLTGAYMLGASEFHINLGKAGDYSKTVDSGAKQYTLGYNYKLSKRTKVYGYYTNTNAERNTGYASDLKALALGVRHNF